MSAENIEEAQETAPQRLNPWIQLIIGLATIGGMIWAVLTFFDPIGDVDLTVQLLEEVPVSLPVETDSLPVQLTYQGSSIGHALFLTIQVANTGNRPIGSDDDLWTLTIRTAAAEQLSLAGPLRPAPTNVAVTPRSPASDRIALDIGLFNPDDRIGLELVLIDPHLDAVTPLTAETRIPGLEEPTVTRLNVRERIRDAFIPPLWLVLGIAVFAGLLWEAIREGSLTVGRGLVSLFLAIFSSGAAAAVVAWMLSAVVAAALHG